MNRQDFNIIDTQILSGARADVEMPLPKLSSHTRLDMPVHVIHGKQDSPVMVVSAAIHGDELNNIEIVQQCTHGIDLHTGSTYRTILPQIGANLDDPETCRLAHSIGVPVFIISSLK